MERVAKWLAIDHQKASPSNKQFYQRAAQAFIRRSNITAEALESLISMEGETVHDIAKLATTPPSVLLKLTEYEGQVQDIHKWDYIAKNPNTPAEALEILFSRLKQLKSPHSIDYYIAVHPNTPVKLLEELVTHPNLRMALSKNPNTPVKLLEEFATHPDLINTVIANPNTPSELLRQLANDAQNDLLAIIAENPNTPVDLLLRFVASPHLDIRRGLAKNTEAPISILETLAHDKKEEVRLVLARNPSVTVAILERLATDPDERVYGRILKRLHSFWHGLLIHELIFMLQSILIHPLIAY